VFQGVPPILRTLGLMGLIPFLAGAFGVWAAPVEIGTFILVLQMSYAALILSFLGAIHWGFAIAGYGGDKGRNAAAPARYAGGTVPLILGWAATIAPPIAAMLILIAGFAAVFFFDLYYVRRGLLPDWYPALRKPLTIVAVLSLAASLGRILV